MSFLLNLISERLTTLNLSEPLPILDLVLALIIILGSLLYLKRFPVFRVVLGMVLLFTFSLIFLAANFILTGLIFGTISLFIAFSMPLIFAPEIRHYLEKLGRFYFVRLPNWSKKQKRDIFIRNLVDAAYEMAEKKIGALIVLERRTKLGNLIETGIRVDARLGAKLLQTIFYPNSPLHDGAVVIREGKIIAAKCTIPLAPQIKLDPPFGLRHKAGLSMTLETDAAVIIISEQRGEVSVAENGKFEINLNRITLSEKLHKLFLKY